MRTSTLRNLALLLGALPWGIATADVIDDVQPGHWAQIPNTKIRDVATPDHQGEYYIGNVKKIIETWSGASFDPVNERMYIKGGGHGAYGGNEVYAMDFNTLTLELKWGPSQFEGWSDGDLLMPDGAPVAAHSNDHVEFVPALGQVCTFTNTSTWQHALQWDITTYCLNFDTGIWEAKAQMGNTGNYMFSALDPVTGHIYVHGGGSLRFLNEYDPVADQWIDRGTKWSDQDHYFGAYITGEVDPQRRLFIAIGDDFLLGWDITAEGNVTGVTLPANGDTELINSLGPGFTYDSANDQFVGWDGGADVYLINPDTWEFVRTPPAPTNTVIPSSTDNTFGTYGRFRYLESRNAFVLVNSVDEDFYVYRLATDDPPPPADTDADGANDAVDNCLTVANPMQLDGDADGYGNACDADLDNNCVVDFPDLALMKDVFFGEDANADLDGNGTVDFADLLAMKAAFFEAPGPSALTSVCDQG